MRYVFVACAVALIIAVSSYAQQTRINASQVEYTDGETSQEKYDSGEIVDTNAGTICVSGTEFLAGDGVCKVPAGSGNPGGTEGQVQVNEAGSFGGIDEGTVNQVLTSQGPGLPPTFQDSQGGTTPPAGTTGQVQINEAGAFGAVSEGNADEVLTSNGPGVNPSFQPAPVTDPGGSSGQVQANSAGSFVGIAEGIVAQVLTSNGIGSLPTFQDVPLTPPAGTVGQVQTNGGAAFSAIQEGLANQVLTSNGPGVAPTFQDPQGGTGTPGGNPDELQYNAAGSFGGVANGVVGSILVAQGLGPPAFSETLDLPAHPTEGGSLVLKESQAAGTDTWGLKLPDAGIAGTVTCELLSDGKIPAVCLDATVSGTPGGSEGQVQWNSSSTFAGIAEGLATQVLTSNGPGLPPSFQDPSAAGTPGGNFDELQFNDAGSFGGLANGADGEILTARPTGPPAFSDTLDLPAQATEGGSITLKEAQSSGADTWSIKVPDTGLNSTVTCELGADGRIPAACLSGSAVGMTNFIIAGSTGTETVEDGETIFFVPGVGVSSTPVTPPNTVTLNVEVTQAELDTKGNITTQAWGGSHNFSNTTSMQIKASTGTALVGDGAVEVDVDGSSGSVETPWLKYVGQGSEWLIFGTSAAPSANGQIPIFDLATNSVQWQQLQGIGTRIEYFSSWALNPDGTFCEAPREITMNTGPRVGAIRCQDSGSSNIHGNMVLPLNYDGGGIQARIEMYTATDLGDFGWSFAVQCVSSGEQVSPNFAQARLFSLTFSLANTIEHALNEIASNNVCQAGDSLFFELRVDSLLSNVATADFIGLSLTYPVIVGL